MQIEQTPLQGCLLLKPTVFEDNRGYFFESFNEKQFEELTGQRIRFVQDNQSYSQFGVIRGLHGQLGEFAQAKLVRALKGEILDVAVDLRKGSSTHGQHFGVILSAENKQQLFIPEGFLHGFSVLSNDAVVFYKCNNYYNKHAEFGIRYDDEKLNIDWQIPMQKQIISEKDLLLGEFVNQ